MSDDGSLVLFRELLREQRFRREEKRLLKDFGRILGDRVAPGRAFTCLITNDEELRKLNNDFLGRDYATDVLSFPAASPNGSLGDIAISLDRAEAQATEFGHSRAEEIQLLMLHGVLHLTGMDHDTDRGEMALAERNWRKELGLVSNLIARTRQAAR